MLSYYCQIGKDFLKFSEKEKNREMTTIVKELNGLTIGELKTILEQVPNEVEICVWGSCVDLAEIEVNIFTDKVADVFVNIETVPSY